MECIARSQQLCCLDDEFLWSCSSSVFLLKIRSVRILDMTVPRLRRKCRAVELKLNSVVLDLKHRPGILGSDRQDQHRQTKPHTRAPPHCGPSQQPPRPGCCGIDAFESAGISPNRISGAIDGGGGTARLCAPSLAADVLAPARGGLAGRA